MSLSIASIAFHPARSAPPPHFNQASQVTLCPLFHATAGRKPVPPSYQSFCLCSPSTARFTPSPPPPSTASDGQGLQAPPLRSPTHWYWCQASGPSGRRSRRQPGRSGGLPWPVLLGRSFARVATSAGLRQRRTNCFGQHWCSPV